MGVDRFTSPGSRSRGGAVGVRSEMLVSRVICRAGRVWLSSKMLISPSGARKGSEFPMPIRHIYSRVVVASVIRMRPGPGHRYDQPCGILGWERHFDQGTAHVHTDYATDSPLAQSSCYQLLTSNCKYGRTSDS